ncbi:alginate lyase family protein [Candidatus Thioglobus sp.]|nr:alginate lyase family protein [Candidatus Thioglobus sp.]
MKKLFLLLILSFFSAQSFAGSCPDGSEPVKSISDDGTYFVYNCSGSADSSNETSSTKSNGLLPNTLKQIKVIKDWEPVSDFGALKEYAKQVPIDEFRVRKNKEWNCVDRITNVNPYPDEDTHRPWFHCQAYVHGLAASNPQILRDILLTWASATKDPMFVIPVTKSGGYNVAGYDIPSTIGTFAQSYAFWYDEIEYTPDERKRVDAYMTKKLIEQKFPVMNYGRRPCDINNINSVFHKDTGTNNCGNIRMKVAVGEIMLGFRLENQILLDKGHDDMYVVHAFINEDGININHASRGGNTVNYSWEYTYYASLLAEIYDSVGYDYLEHKLPRGAKVHEHLSFNYRLLKDFKLTAPWAKHNVGSLSNSYSKIKNLSQEDFEKSDDFGQNVYRWEDGDKEFVKAHTKFVKRYMPELYTFDVKNYMGSKFNESPNFGVHPYMLHLGNNFIEENNNVELIQKQVELEDEKDDVSCKVSSLRGGEYIARWYVAIPEENWEPKYKGMDILTLAKDNCKGKIHSNERFWPSSSDGDKLKNSSIRDKLKIRWKPNGHITISGDLVYWPLGRNLYTFLEGNLNNGKISGEHEEGDKITIEIISKKKFEEGKQVELEKSSSKLSIFEVDGQTFSLSIDKADLTIPRTIRLDRDERYLQPYQLHKAVISGRLKTKSNGSKRFETLVYKYDTTQERKLVIHVDDPTIKPLKRHKDSLQKLKCGLDEIEWGWLSFISQTNNIKSARNQQCIYDYFKEANDRESWELFKAVLGGTDSILDYLETNVEK